MVLLSSSRPRHMIIHVAPEPAKLPCRAAIMSPGLATLVCTAQWIGPGPFRLVSVESYTSCRPAANDRVGGRRDAVCIPPTEPLMTRNLRSTNGDEELPSGAKAPGDTSAAAGPSPQSREHQRRPAPAASAPSAPVASRPAAKPAVPAASALSAQPQRATRTLASFDPASSREALIATAAYYRAQKRGFRPGHDLEDWLAAEREIDGAGTGTGTGTNPI